MVERDLRELERSARRGDEAAFWKLGLEIRRRRLRHAYGPLAPGDVVGGADFHQEGELVFREVRWFGGEFSRLAHRMRHEGGRMVKSKRRSRRRHVRYRRFRNGRWEDPKDIFYETWKIWIRSYRVEILGAREISGSHDPHVDSDLNNDLPPPALPLELHPVVVPRWSAPLRHSEVAEPAVGGFVGSPEDDSDGELTASLVRALGSLFSSSPSVLRRLIEWGSPREARARLLRKLRPPEE